MDAMQAPPRLPGTSANELAKWSALAIGTALLVVFVPLTLLDTVPVGRSVGHLPWPLVQWALASPVGVLALMAVGILLVAPPYVLLGPGAGYWRRLAGAIDVTESPLEAWPKRTRADAGRTRMERWLGRGHREPWVSLVLFVLAVLLAVALLAMFIAASIFSFAELGSLSCEGQACPPNFPVTSIALVSTFASIALSSWTYHRWLRRAEASSGVWLRYRDILWAAPLYYVRRPGVTPEAAAAALTRFGLAGGAPLARTFAITVLAMTPLVLLQSASIYLQGWLRFQWILR
jgi:hypothetical protein